MNRRTRQLNTRQHQRGFTLMEVMIVMFLIVLLMGFVTSLSIDSLTTSKGAKPAYEVFREAAHEGRIQAITQAQVIYLTFDAEKQAFMLTSRAAPPVEAQEEREVNRYGYFEDEPEAPPPVPGEGRTEFAVYEDELEVEFRGVQAEVDGPSAFTDEFTQDPLPHLTFHPSGVSSPAIAILHYQNGEDLTLTLDAFSNGPQLSREEGVGF